MPQRMLLDMGRLAERVRAAAWMVPAKQTLWRRLETRSREQFRQRPGWMVPLDDGTPEAFAVELVPCDPDEPGATSLQRHQSAEQIRLDAEVLYELWLEERPQRAAVTAQWRRVAG